MEESRGCIGAMGTCYHLYNEFLNDFSHWFRTFLALSARRSIESLSHMCLMRSWSEIQWKSCWCRSWRYCDSLWWAKTVSRWRLMPKQRWSEIKRRSINCSNLWVGMINLLTLPSRNAPTSSLLGYFFWREWIIQPATYRKIVRWCSVIISLGDIRSGMLRWIFAAGADGILVLFFEIRVSRGCWRGIDSPR